MKQHAYRSTRSDEESARDDTNYLDLQTPPFDFPGLNRLARVAHMSRKTFSQYFRKTTGISPLQFATDLK